MLREAAKSPIKWIAPGIFLAGALVVGIFLTPRELIRSPMPNGAAKLFQILAHYQKRDCKVVYNGTTYEMANLVGPARRYIVSHYNGGDIRSWVRSHLYRTPDEGEIIYLILTNGQMRPLRDVLLEELDLLFPA